MELYSISFNYLYWKRIWKIYIYMNHFAVHVKLTLHCKSTVKVKVRVAQSSPTLCDSVDCAVRGILQARTLEWVVVPFSRGSSQPRDQTQVSHIAGGFFTSWATREASLLQLFLFFFFLRHKVVTSSEFHTCSYIRAFAPVISLPGCVFSGLLHS